MDFQQYFHTHLDEFLNKNSGEKTVVLFRGFSPAQNAEILSRADALAPAGILMEDGTLDIAALDARKQQAAEAVLAAKGPCVGVYEQWIAALSAMPDLPMRFGGTAVVAEDNLFSSYYPSAVPADAAKALYAYFQEDSADAPEGLGVYLNYYGDVDSLDESHDFTALLNRDGGALKAIPFFPEEEIVPAQGEPGGVSVPVSGRAFLTAKADLLNGRLPDTADYTFDSRDGCTAHGLPAFAGILRAMGLPCSVRGTREFNITEKGSAEKYLPLLRKYWGDGADFRMLKFYRDPYAVKGTEELSQGEIIAQIIAQSAAALAGRRDFHNLFITAPTGAGKSLLFQLPAIHLAEQYGAVTIVITPLIALMKDQVSQLEQERHVTCATFINSTLTFEERESRIAQIRSGQKSIVYLAPELLVSTPLEAVTGGRPVGLFVIDEAHIVTSWGKDFRADYWYLGEFLNSLKRGGAWFPVLCLTATAVCGGPEDVVDETIGSLLLGDPYIYLGSVRRDNIEFDIRHVDPKRITGGVEAFKVKKAAEAVKGFVERGEKTLVYCPFTTQVDDIYIALDANVRPKVKKYYGTLDKQTRDEAQNSFRSGECTVMVCTKAFGMGVDVRDIRNVYHFAPTGSLADYVQEIGRAAREQTSHGCAAADFLPTDIRYVRTLNGISEMKQYQLREMLRKINVLCREKCRRSLFLSPDAFSYLFGTRELENKVKNGLLLLSKDLESVYGYPVLTVRPRAMLTKSFVNVPLSAVQDFERSYGPAVKPLEDRTKRVLPSRNKRYESDTTVVNSGKIYELDMPAIWAGHFQSMSFSQYNYKFFNGDLFHCATGENFSPRIHIRAHYGLPFHELEEKLKERCTALSDIFRTFKNNGKMFTAEDFKKALADAFGQDFERLEFSGMLLDLFVADLAQNVGFRANSDRLKFIAARKAPSGEFAYRVLNTGYLTMPNYFVQLASQCAPGENNIFQAFIPLGRNNRQPERLRLLAFLELLGLASYQVEGGQNMEVFVRVNDPQIFSNLTEQKYTNGVLTDIRRRHKSAQSVMLSFLARDLSSDERWNVVEDYFLGREDAVLEALQSPEAAGEETEKTDEP